MSELEYAEFCKKTGFNGKFKHTHIEAQKSRFISLGDPHDICEFYLALTQDGTLKFGISGNTELRAFIMNFKTIHCIYKSTRVKIAELEADLKYELDTSSEYLPFTELRKILNIIKYLIDRQVS